MHEWMQSRGSSTPHQADGDNNLPTISMRGRGSCGYRVTQGTAELPGEVCDFTQATRNL